MPSTFKIALALLALGASTLPAIAQERAPRAGAPTAVVVAPEITAFEARRPRSGSPVVAIAPDSAHLASAAVVATDLVPEPGLCGRKYCGVGAGR